MSADRPPGMWQTLPQWLLEALFVVQVARMARNFMSLT